MNTVVVKRRNGGPNRRRNRRAARSNTMVMVQAPRPTGRGGRRRRNRRRSNRGGRNRGGSGETFVFSKDNLSGSSSGAITFGPSLSDCPAFSSGILKAYHEYKISMVKVEFISEAASTSSGSIAYELDPHCKSTSLQSYVNKFGITRNGQRTWTGRLINGVEWHDTTEDQFRLLYKGNGSNAIAGSFRITIKCQTQNPK
uniref:Coat protein n=2 Tax=Cowpea polerovirus 1 TaxID=1913124 RepID=A0A1I9W7C0_9VIRU|nr:coat protein [Cowpea polerovirus 1]APA23050.1 coat protein [Cowpea polerovirus 1]APA23056.1 coat protein [Cowpea polerovirus 1]APA23059.1 coat protein [Cowpea polerovirus 1]APA23062.1 coat protein [Cowpea polerovirus 1]